jgi:hypothetical protein
MIFMDRNFHMRFSLLHSVQTGSGVHSTSYPTGSGARSPGVKRPGCEADYSRRSSADVKDDGTILPLPHPSLRRGDELSTGITFPPFLSTAVNSLLPSSRKLDLNSALQLGCHLMTRLIKIILTKPRLFQRATTTKDFRTL